MACASQSALNYLKSARRHLVGGLKNLSVIVENLHQQKVFTDEEVCKIQTEKDDWDKTRAILDSVTKKGEAACEVLLRIIDMTRMRSLERISPFPEETTESSTEPKQFDLNHWISCFPFEEDTQMYGGCLQGPRPCHMYQEKLMERVQKKVKEFWMRNEKLLCVNHKSDLSYSPLVLNTQGSGSPSKIKKFKIKKSKMSRPKKLRMYIPEDESKVSPSDLLKTNKNILLVGKPGIGKTALCHEILKLWVEKKSEKLDYMFYFDMRERSHVTGVMSLEELLFSVYCEPDDGKDKVLQDIKQYSDNVTVIFDGITDLTCSVVKHIVEKDLPNAKVIITCRPDDEEDFFYGDFLRVEVKGFSEQTIKLYLLPILGEEHKKIMCDLELLTLCHVPVYALMVAACLLSKTPEDLPQPHSKTEININIVRFCLQVSSSKTKKYLNSFIQEKKMEILSLAELAFHATERKTVSLTNLHCEDRCVLSFLKPLVVQVAPTETKTTHAFLHYTVQEFFAALWLLKNPNEIKGVLQQCLKEEQQHMKHLIPFMCRLLTEKSPSLMEHLIPAQELKNTSNWFFKALIDSGFDDDIRFLCECLYESHCPEAGVYLLKRLNYHLDLSGESLDPYLCCAVANVVALSRERKVSLDLEGVSVSEQGVRRLLGCLDNVQWSDPLPQQLWEIILLSEEQLESVTLLSCDGHQLHLPLQGKRQLFERAVSVIQKNPMKVNVCLHWDSGETAVSRNLSKSLLEALHYIKSLSFSINNMGPGQQEKEQSHEMWEKEKMKLLLDLCRKAALYRELSFHSIVNRLISLFSVDNVHHLLLDFHQHVKSTKCFSVIPKLKALYESAPSVWSIDLSKRKTSILLEVLKLQTERKHVKLKGYPDESEVKIFLQCLPHISDLSFPDQVEGGVKFCRDLFCAAAKSDQWTGGNTVELLLSVCRYETFPHYDTGDSDDVQFSDDSLLDLYSSIKTYENKTGLSVLPSVQSVFQSTSSVWSLDLSKRKTSILLEVLKLQTEKKHIELWWCSEEEDEVMGFLHCLPYISQLSFSFWSGDDVKFCGSLFCAAANEEKQLEMLLSVCRYETFPFHAYDSTLYPVGFLLDLYSYITKSSTYKGLSVLPLVQSFFQSTPSVWYIDLSERKPSILLEVLKLQTEKKHVELKGYPNKISEVKIFLLCLPHISDLSFPDQVKGGVKFCRVLFCAATESDQETGGNTVEMLLSVCRYVTFPHHDTDNSDDFQFSDDSLLDLYSSIKTYEDKTGLNFLSLVQSVFQSTPSVWSIDLSERKTSILLEVLKLQTERKHVELKDYPDDESEVKIFLQCLPHISDLSFPDRVEGGVKFCRDLFCAAAKSDQETGGNTVDLLLSVCRYETFPRDDTDNSDDFQFRDDSLLDLCSSIKTYEKKTGLIVLPSVQSVFQSTPSVWFVDFSERKTSILLEVLKLQTKEKHVKLKDYPYYESEVKIFLQCLPHISDLSFPDRLEDGVKFCRDLFCAAAKSDRETGGNTVELLLSVCRYETFPRHDTDNNDFIINESLLDLYSSIKTYENKTGLSFLPSVQSVFQSTPSVWSIDLSERKTSILLEVLKLQTERKHIKLCRCSAEEDEVIGFLHCLPYISQLSFRKNDWSEDTVRFCGSLFCAAANEEDQLEMLLSVCRYETFPCADFADIREIKDNQCDFLLDLYSYIKESITYKGLSFLPSVQSFFRSTPSVWSIDLSKTKTSILLEVLKLQTEKKHVKLKDYPYYESEVKIFLQCLPRISDLSFPDRLEGGVKFCRDLFCAAAKSERETGRKKLELLFSVCRYETFPLHDTDNSGDFIINDSLLDLYSSIKTYEKKTGLSVLPSVQSVFQSTPSVWSIDLSKTKTSILLEVLKLQTEKKDIVLWRCSEEEDEVMGFLHCLPYISQLSFDDWSRDGVKFCGSLFCAAASEEDQLEMLLSVCRYETFPCVDFEDIEDIEDNQCDFLLDLYSYIKKSITYKGLSVLPSVQSFFQSAASVWSIDLSKTKTSILLEVLKLQTERKHVKLKDYPYDESEVKIFLQCLPHISDLSFSEELEGGVKFCRDLFCAAAKSDQETGGNTVELLLSVCRFETFPLHDTDNSDDFQFWDDSLLDLFSSIKTYEKKTGWSVLPSVQSVFQSTHSFWIIDLSKTKTSILLEVLILQTEEKDIELWSCSEEEDEVMGFLQCLPYISQLSFSFDDWSGDDVKFCGSLFCAAANEEGQLELLLSVCRYKTFPCVDFADIKDIEDNQCNFLLDLYSYIKKSTTYKGLRFLPSVQSVFQSTLSVWSVDLSERKTAILLEVLILQTEKKHVKLHGCLAEEDEVIGFLHCLPYISQLSFDDWSGDVVKFCGSLFCAAANEEEQLELLLSVCRYETFPFHCMRDTDQCSFLLDLYSYIVTYEKKTGLSVLPSVQSVFQSTPSVWSIDLSKTKTSILLKVLKLQTEEKHVKLHGCLEEEDEVKSFLQCLPYISQLSCGPEFFQSVCTSVSVRSKQEAEQVAFLLQLLGFNLQLKGKLLSQTCRSVEQVLDLCGPSVDLILTLQKISARGALLLFRKTRKLRSLRLSTDMALTLSRWVKRGRVAPLSVTDELSLVSETIQRSERVWLKVVSSLAYLLRHWTVRQLDLTESTIPAQALIPLLLHNSPLTIKLNEKTFELLLNILNETQDENLTRSFLSKINGDLTPFSLNWELLHFLLQQSSPQILTVNMRENSFPERSFAYLLPDLDRVVFERPSSSFVLTVIREIYKARASSIIPGLLRSCDDVINLTCKQLNSEDCAALLYTLEHSDGVKLNLLRTLIPPGEINLILSVLNKVSHLSVDRKLLLEILHSCAASDAVEEKAVSLLRALQHRLDLSCSSCVEMSEEGQSETFCLTVADCRVISTVLRYSSQDTELNLQDCVVESSGLDLLSSVLNRVKLRASKVVVLQLMSMLDDEFDGWSRAESLHRALGGELNFSHTKLDQKACESLALMLDFVEEVTELDLSHCRLTDQLLCTLIKSLHKVKVLDLSHNRITGASTSMLLELISNDSCTETVRLLGNTIVDQTPFKENKHFAIC
ncbi:uncharacterized protein LOC127378595 isoform X1 [Xyrichtys novacula]|uniref:Uncharacterized protein LOC127378595 isoform X1 n=1 Tax=Xyrichtys novacula TaxID=13765 RepID=A0AAV1HQV7_XYRNO|nr:uncharacterized protein LOC127378595 isoform X1 [Xyrichtys novacula]